MCERAEAFCQAHPELADIMTFVDDMTVNGMLIEKPLHTGKNEGIHFMPFPLWQFNRYGIEGFEFIKGVDTVFHEDEATPVAAEPQALASPLNNPN